MQEEIAKNNHAILKRTGLELISLILVFSLATGCAMAFKYLANHHPYDNLLIEKWWGPLLYPLLLFSLNYCIRRETALVRLSLYNIISLVIFKWYEPYYKSHVDFIYIGALILGITGITLVLRKDQKQKRNSTELKVKKGLLNSKRLKEEMETTTGFNPWFEIYFAILLVCSLFLIYKINYEFSVSQQYKTVYSTYLLIILSPVLIMMLIYFSTNRKNVFLGRLALETPLLLILLVLVLKDIWVVKVLWFPTLCFPLIYLLSLRKHRVTIRKRRAVYIPDNLEMAPDDPEELERRAKLQSQNKHQSKSVNTGWVSTYFTHKKHR